MMLLRFADGRFAQVTSVGFRDGGGIFDVDLVCERGTLRIDFERGVSIGRGGKWTDVANSHDPAWMHNGVVREWQAMAACFEELAEVQARLRDRTWIGHADAIEAERAGLVRERGLEIGGGEFGGFIQKSRST